MLASKVIEAAIAVHRELGPGLPEQCYQAALEWELLERGIPFCREHLVRIHYRDHMVGQARLDFLIDERLVVELKAVEVLSDAHKAQVLTYLKITKCQLGLLMNFHSPVLVRGTKRIIHQP